MDPGIRELFGDGTARQAIGIDRNMCVSVVDRVFIGELHDKNFFDACTGDRELRIKGVSCIQEPFDAQTHTCVEARRSAPGIDRPIMLRPGPSRFELREPPQPRGLVHLAVRDHQRDVADRMDVRQWIARDNYEVRTLAHLDRADIVDQSHHPGWHRRRRLDRRHRRESSFHIKLELAVQ